ncbi:MAG: KTSC domain-containing protein [Parafilimonas sp.]|nr:KTSC domain-containing protein [Parafilimonas sp.]
MAEERYGHRLQTRNFRPVTSGAILSIDYSPKNKLVEVEFKDSDIYHYLDAKKKEWEKMLEFVRKKEGLGGYVNSVFKDPYNKGEAHNNYRLTLFEFKHSIFLQQSIYSISFRFIFSFHFSFFYFK